MEIYRDTNERSRNPGLAAQKHFISDLASFVAEDDGSYVELRAEGQDPTPSRNVSHRYSVRLQPKEVAMALFTLPTDVVARAVREILDDIVAYDDLGYGGKTRENGFASDEEVMAIASAVYRGVLEHTRASVPNPGDQQKSSQHK